jgi:hypothetical protein
MIFGWSPKILWFDILIGKHQWGPQSLTHPVGTRCNSFPARNGLAPSSFPAWPKIRLVHNVTHFWTLYISQHFTFQQYLDKIIDFLIRKEMTSFMYKPEPLLAIFRSYFNMRSNFWKWNLLTRWKYVQGGSKFSNTQNKNEYCNVNGKTDL